jgi:hypothetical protein
MYRRRARRDGVGRTRFDPGYPAIKKQVSAVGPFTEGSGTTVKSGRYLRAGADQLVKAAG